MQKVFIKTKTIKADLTISIPGDGAMKLTIHIPSYLKGARKDLVELYCRSEVIRRLKVKVDNADAISRNTKG